jgi:hypothetical protein
MTELTVDYIRGFVDGEGSFHVGIEPNKSMRTGFQLVPKFSVGLSDKAENREVLEAIRRTLGVGKVYANSNHVEYIVEKIGDLTRYVIPFFEKNPLIIKRADFDVWKQIIKHINRGDHLTKYGMRTYIIPLIEKLYSLRKEKRPRTGLLQLKKALGSVDSGSLESILRSGSSSA